MYAILWVWSVYSWVFSTLSLQTLGLGNISDADLHSCFAELHGRLHDTGGNYVLHVANRLFGEKSFNFVKEFLDQSLKHYKAQLAAVDFRGNCEGARQEVNQWVEEQTAQRIKDIMPPGSVDAMTMLILVNAIYFKGDWNDKFDAKDTNDDAFHVSDTEKVTVPMMYKKKDWTYGADGVLDAQCIELPYANNSLSMFILLPGPGKMEKLQEALSPEFFANIEKKFRLSPKDTKLWLPRFKLEDSFDLSGKLADMGMRDLFDQGKANLQGMDEQNRLFVQKVLHKSFLEVNEEGSEAAAATAVKVMLRSLPKVFEFRANRPFLFFIRENSTRSILFFGKLAKPTAAKGKDEL